MPPIYYLNPPPNPFWDFIAGLEDHPFFAGPPRHAHQHHGPPPPPPDAAPNAAASQPTAEPEMSEKAKGKQATVEDPPEVDPSTVKPSKSEKTTEKDFPFRGRGRFTHVFDGDNDQSGCGRGGHACRGRARGGRGGPPAFMMHHPFFARPPWSQHGPDHSGPPGPPPHVRGPWGHRGARGPHCRPSPPHGPRSGFDLGEFLNRLGDKLGIDLTNAAEGLGLTADRFTAGRTSQDVDFEPRSDIFENKDAYTIHLSVPGAKKSDIGVEYDGEHSVLRITGVVHRPDVDEQMMSELVVDGRKRETGVFEKAIRLGTKRDPASIDSAKISAKMTDGVLVVKIPKVEKVHRKREVLISTDPVVEGKADYEDEYSEKPALFDAVEERESVADTETEGARREVNNFSDAKESKIQEDSKEKDASETKPQSKHEEAHEEEEKAASSAKEEQLPAYSADAEHEDEHEEEDWEKFSDVSGEGEYIKINVD